MNLRDRARARMLGKLVRINDAYGSPTVGVVIDLDYEHTIHTDRPPRQNPDTGLIVKLERAGGITTYWYHLYYAAWQVFGEPDVIDPDNP